MIEKAKLSAEEALYTTKTKKNGGNEKLHEHADKVVNISVTKQEEMIAKAAYFKAAQRNFSPGHELDDWLDAEADIYGLIY